MDFVYLKNTKFPTKLAITEDEQSRGLMFETNPQVMAFIYPNKRFIQFWMKNTPLPLDIVFASNNKIVAIEKGEPFSTSLIGGNLPSDLVVEFPFGTVQKLGIKIGDNIQIEYSKNSFERILTSQLYSRFPK